MKYYSYISSVRLRDMTYRAAIQKLGDYIGKETWHDYMEGSMNPYCEDEHGIVKAISVIYGTDIEKVKIDLENHTPAINSYNKK